MTTPANETPEQAFCREFRALVEKYNVTGYACIDAEGAPDGFVLRVGSSTVAEYSETGYWDFREDESQPFDPVWVGPHFRKKQ